MKDLRLESRLGFDKIRRMISDCCLTDYAADRVEREEFSDDPAQITERLALTDEMRLIMMFEDSFPTTGYIDALPFLEPLQKSGSCIDVLSLGKLKTATETTRRLTRFFSSVKDGIYPRLKHLASGISTFPEVQRRIDDILDRYGDIRDSASDQLLGIRGRIRSKEAAISKKAAAILQEAQANGYADADASVNIRDGKYLIPVSSSSKRKVQGFVYDESASGKTTFIEPAEIIELVLLHRQRAQVLDFLSNLIRIRTQIHPFGSATEAIFHVGVRELMQHTLHHRELVEVGIEKRLNNHGSLS